MMDGGNVEFSAKLFYLLIYYECLFHTRVIVYNVFKARKVVPYFFEWGSDFETIGEFDHNKEFIFIR
jgi:hypothetical protein